MDLVRVRTPFCGTGTLRSVAIAAGVIYVIIALAGIATGFGYKFNEYGYGRYGENYFLLLLGTTCIMWIIANISLLYGTFMKRHKFLLPWLFWHMIFLILGVVELIWSSIVLAELSEQPNAHLRNAAVATLCCVVPYLCTATYFSVVVYSLYCDLKGAVYNNTPERRVITMLQAPSNNENEPATIAVTQLPRGGTMLSQTPQYQTVTRPSRRQMSQEEEAANELDEHDGIHYYADPSDHVTTYENI